MAAQFTTVSEDFYNRNQSWYYAGVFRNASGTFRVEVRANAHRDQSHAKIEVWGVGGWNFHTSLPVETWYENAPSYTKRTLDPWDYEAFDNVRDELLGRLALALWNSFDGITIDGVALTVPA